MKLFDKFRKKNEGLPVKFPEKVEYNEEVSEKMSALCREVGAEGIVMLKNDGVLPLDKGCRVSVFGRVQYDYFYAGSGTGGIVNVPYRVSLIEGLKNCHDIEVNAGLADIYEDWCKKSGLPTGKWENAPTFYEEMPLTKAFAAEMSRLSDVAVVVIGRSAGEGRDSILEDGSYYLTKTERQMLSYVCRTFSKVVVLLNSGNIIDMSWVDEYRISALLYVWQGGMESGNSVADVLCGKVSPSGKLTDTIAKKYEDYPSSKNFSNKKVCNYQEDIFVDYRYFETFSRGSVLYPFGFGLSYADFEIKPVRTVYKNGTVSISVDVINISENFSGKEVVQVYVEPPQGVLGKEARRLVAFGKTKLLAPGESQRLRLSFDNYSMASFDDSGISGHKNCYILEAGAYNIHMGNSVRNTSLARKIVLGRAIVYSTLDEVCAPKFSFERLVAREENGRLVPKTLPAPTTETDLKARILANLPEELEYTGDIGLKFDDVKSGRCSLDEFVAQLDLDELEILAGGDEYHSALGPDGNANAFVGLTESLREKGLPVVVCADGPTGLGLEARCSMTPACTAIASTFNKELVRELFTELSLEMKERRVDMLLGPGMNIHRNPLCGRNFEYYSADPFVSGTIAAAVVEGLQTNGGSACPKHFACNNREDKKNATDFRVSQRALREIYLKGFEIMVKTAHPKSIMTSYNQINGVYNHYNYDLCRVVLRKEWGYEGNIMTDWGIMKKKMPEFPTISDNGYVLRAGINIYNPGPQSDSKIKKSMKGRNGLTMAELQRNAKEILLPLTR